MGNQDTGSKICRSLFGIPPSTGRIETGMGNSGTIIRIMISSAQNNGELSFAALVSPFACGHWQFTVEKKKDAVKDQECRIRW